MGDGLHLRGTWGGFVYTAFILDCYAQKIVAWNTAANKTVELVDVPLRIALWQRDRDGHPHVPGELICHADAGTVPATAFSALVTCSSMPRRLLRARSARYW